MELAVSLCALCGAIVICTLAAALGCRLLRWLRVEIAGDAKSLLCGVVVGVVALEAALFLAQFGGHIPLSFAVVLAVSALASAVEVPGILRRVRNIANRAWNDSLANRLLGCATLCALAIEGFSAMAPLTGSDALHYHFATEAAVLRNGFAPDFFLSHSFLTGQGHLLILLGLAFHSEKLALGLLYCGGALAAAAAACLVRGWTDRQHAWLAALAFVVSPVVFWQISTAGAPDLWMGLFSAAGVLAIAQISEKPSTGLAVLCGMCAGITAGTKYTGCIVAVSLLLAFLWEARSIRLALIFIGASLGAGIWPYARNLAWTDDPVFPFALKWFPVAHVNNHALAALLADTGTTERTGFWQILKFPFFAAIDAKHIGFWQFFGPLCLIFAPMFLLLVRRNALWRASIVVWFGSAVGIGAMSGMLRFLVLVFPIALAGSFAGVAALRARARRAAHWLAMTAVAITLVMGFAAMVVYLRPALAAGLGLVSREKYLQEYCPDYATTQFINNGIETLSSDAGNSGGKTLVFLRHLYNLRVPFVDGNLDASWAVDSDRLHTAGSWRAFFRENGIRWVARAPAYPALIAAPLSELEAEGVLVPVVRGDVSELSGMRILNQRKVLPVVILQVKD